MTDEEKLIVETLRYCEESGARCESCPSGKNREGVPNCHSQSRIADLIEQLSAERDQMESECNVAMEDIYSISFEYMCCTICSHHGESLNKEPCKSCGLGYLNNHFSWRGPQDEP